MRIPIAVVVLFLAVPRLAAAQVSMPAETPSPGDKPTPRSLQVDVIGELGVFFSTDPLHFLYTGASARVVLAGTSPYSLRVPSRHAYCSCAGKRPYWARTGFAVEAELRSGWLHGYESVHAGSRGDCVSEYRGTERVRGAAVGVRWFYAISQRNVFARIVLAARVGMMRSRWFADQSPSADASEALRRSATSMLSSEGSIHTVDGQFGIELGGQHAFFIMGAGLGMYNGEHTGTGGSMTFNMGFGGRF